LRLGEELALNLTADSNWFLQGLGGIYHGRERAFAARISASSGDPAQVRLLSVTSVQMTLSKPWPLQEHCYNTAGPVSAAGLIGATLPQFGWRLQTCVLRNQVIWVNGKAAADYMQSCRYLV